MTVLNWPLLISVMALIVATIALTIVRLNRKTLDDILVVLNKKQSPGAQLVQEQVEFQAPRRPEPTMADVERILGQGMQQLDRGIAEMNRTIDQTFGNHG